MSVRSSMRSPIPKGANPTLHLLRIDHGVGIARLVAAGHEGSVLLDVRRLFQDDLAPRQFFPEVGAELRCVGEVGPLAPLPLARPWRPPPQR